MNEWQERLQQVSQFGRTVQPHSSEDLADVLTAAERLSVCLLKGYHMLRWSLKCDILFIWSAAADGARGAGRMPG